jgi:hypothetical protein
LIIFIAQNSNQVTIHFLGLDGRISLALALLIAAVGSPPRRARIAGGPPGRSDCDYS